MLLFIRQNRSHTALPFSWLTCTALPFSWLTCTNDIRRHTLSLLLIMITKPAQFFLSWSLLHIPARAKKNCAGLVIMINQVVMMWSLLDMLIATPARLCPFKCYGYLSSREEWITAMFFFCDCFFSVIASHLHDTADPLLTLDGAFALKSKRCPAVVPVLVSVCSQRCVL